MASTLTAQRSITDVAVECVASSGATSERAVIDEVVDAVLAECPEGGLVDSHRVAAAVVARRVAAGGDPDPVQTKDYVQYLFRETDEHVCRHADGSHYRIHPQPKCTPECDAKYQHRAARTVRDHCGSCHMELTTAGECPMDC